MCNLYTYRMTAEDMRLLKAHYNLVGRDYLDVLQTRNDETKVFPNYEAPAIIERVVEGGLERVIEPMLWGTRGVTNVPNTKSRHWMRWLKNPASRCVLPVSRFRAGSADQQPFFPEIWTEWEGDRGTKAKPYVKAVHQKAMPVVLTTAAEVPMASCANGGGADAPKTGGRGFARDGARGEESSLERRPAGGN